MHSTEKEFNMSDYVLTPLESFEYTRWLRNANRNQNIDWNDLTFQFQVERDDDKDPVLKGRLIEEHPAFFHVLISLNGYLYDSNRTTCYHPNLDCQIVCCSKETSDGRLDVPDSLKRGKHRMGLSEAYERHGHKQLRANKVVSSSSGYSRVMTRPREVVQETWTFLFECINEREARKKCLLHQPVEM
jgi:hypothetical protein